MKSALRVGHLTLVLDPSRSSYAATRDGILLELAIDASHPLDAAKVVTYQAERCVVAGRVTLLSLAYALVASGITLKPKAELALRNANDLFGLLTKMFDTACTDGADKLRPLLQRLTDEPVTFLPPEVETARFAAQPGDDDGNATFVG